MNFIKICLQIFKAEFIGMQMTLQLPLWLQRRNHKPPGGHLDSVDQQGDPRIRPCRSSRSEATNLKICLTPNGTADRSATNFDRKIFEGKNFVGRRLFFGILRVSLVYFFEQFLFEKITRSPIFSACKACSSKISFDLRSPEIFEFLENLHPMFLHSFRVSASTFEIGNSTYQFSTKIDPYFS
jgi:hypothetical protein